MKQHALIQLTWVFTIFLISSCKQETQSLPPVVSPTPVSNIIPINTWPPIYDSAGVKGAFVLHKMGDSIWMVSDSLIAVTRYLPASTFKIFNSMVALETGVVSDIHTKWKWDGTQRRIDSWNQDHDMQMAFKNSTVWFYQEIARRVGAEKMQYWLDTVGYGNKQMGAALDSFWLIGPVAISPVEQTQFVEKLWNEELPFRKDVQQTVKHLMLGDSTTEYRMYGKTGWAFRKGNSHGWYVGCLEKENETWFFANLVFFSEDSLAPLRKSLTYDILRANGLIPKE